MVQSVRVVEPACKVSQGLKVTEDSNPPLRTKLPIAKLDRVVRLPAKMEQPSKASSFVFMISPGFAFLLLRLK